MLQPRQPPCTASPQPRLRSRAPPWSRRPLRASAAARYDRQPDELVTDEAGDGLGVVEVRGDGAGDWELVATARGRAGGGVTEAVRCDDGVAGRSAEQDGVVQLVLISNNNRGTWDMSGCSTGGNAHASAKTRVMAAYFTAHSSWLVAWVNTASSSSHLGATLDAGRSGATLVWLMRNGEGERRRGGGHEANKWSPRSDACGAVRRGRRTRRRPLRCGPGNTAAAPHRAAQPNDH